MALKRIFVVGFIILFSYLSTYADDKGSESKQKLKNQTLCPVMGVEIDSTAYSDIQGQRIYHCCEMCSKKLKEDPEKYFEKAAKDGIIFENIQISCPVSGKDLTKKEVFTDYKGRRVYFCCENCISKFEKEPQKYLNKLEETKEDKKPETENMNHNH